MNDSVECLSLTSLLGLTEKEAIAKIKAASLIERVVCRDEEWFIFKTEYCFDRVNLTIKDNLVTGANFG